MKIVLLAGANVIHTIRWANGLVERGIDVHIISAHSLQHSLDSRVKCHLLSFRAPLGYIFAVKQVRELLSKIKPDLVNAHYATGYGLLARLVGFRPLLLSVWGSDVYDFPEKSLFHRWLLRENLKFADAIASTSNCMARKTDLTYKHESVFITPFGIDIEEFSSVEKEKNDNIVVIGTVKTLKHKYGIDTLIDAFAIVLQNYTLNDKIELEIIGSGPDLRKLQKKVSDLGINDNVSFMGAIPHKQVPKFLNRFDVYVALSRFDSESFGVAILEASACEKPVIVSDAEGLAEVTKDKITGFVVPKESPLAAADAILKLIHDRDLRRKMGKSGREHVVKHYSWSYSLDIMTQVYSTILNSKNRK